MAQLIFSQLVSLDGYCAGPGGDLSRLPMGQAFDRHNLELLRQAGGLLFGRITFGMFRDYWPAVAADASAEAVPAEIARRVCALPKLVVSDSLSLRQPAPWNEVQVLRRSEAHARLRALKEAPGPSLLAYGSSLLMNDLLQQNLVDELYVLVGNVMLGRGVRCFETDQAAPLALVEQRRLPDSQIVLLRYRLTAADAAPSVPPRAAAARGRSRAS